jgi:hypothetical protein
MLSSLRSRVAVTMAAALAVTLVAVNPIYLEPAGTGGSNPLGDGTCTGHLDAVVQAVAHEPASVLGHDHGGEVALIQLGRFCAPWAA